MHSCALDKIDASDWDGVDEFALAGPTLPGPVTTSKAKEAMPCPQCTYMLPNHVVIKRKRLADVNAMGFYVHRRTCPGCGLKVRQAVSALAKKGSADDPYGWKWEEV